MKIRILIVLVVFIQSAFSQSKNEYLKNNRFDLLKSNFEFPQKDFKIIGFGAYHGSQETENVENILLQKLIQNKKIKYYLPETDFGIAYYFNQYLKSGDTILLKDLVKHYGNRVPQEKTIETYNKWKNIKKINDNQLPINRIEVVGVDISIGMLEVGKEKMKTKKFDSIITMKLADSEELPFEDNYFDALTVGFGVRNFEHLEIGLAEMLRVIRVGGKVVILEFSKPKKFPIKQGYGFISKYIIPFFGKRISKDEKAYAYLPESIAAFPEGEEMIGILEKLGYKNVSAELVSGGIATIYCGSK